MHVRAEYVWCGKKCSTCPHGPYFYGYFRDGGKLHKKYLGKRWQGRDAHVKTGDGMPPEFDAIFNRRTSTVQLALQILGFEKIPTRTILTRRFRELSKKWHPDAGGNARVFALCGAAVSFLRGRVVD